jgi:L-histidine N-alpha-methyltransferase
MLAEVLEGLGRPQKELSPKFFYDHTGSELFEKITLLPEYYLSRTEEALLDRWVPTWVGAMRPATLVELGAGSARKTRTLLDAMTRSGSGRSFVPVDVSGDFLRNTVHQVRAEYPDLSVDPVVADISRPLHLDDPMPEPVLYVLLGSTIGNFPDTGGERLLRGVRDAMSSHDRLLLGADLRPSANKSAAELEAAYNDASGVTAAFNLNVLRVLNRELHATFDLGTFSHRAFYEPDLGRIEMHLVSEVDQAVDVAGRQVRIARGETIRTEISCKYDRPSLDRLLRGAGLVIDQWATDQGSRFCISWIRTREDHD